MDKTEATYHMKRCVDSGLWVADASKVTEDGDSEENVCSEQTKEKK